MRRREFITLLGSAATAWPAGARAQQVGMPVIGFLDSRSPDGLTDRVGGFRQGLKDSGYVEGENVAIEYRWAENQFDRLPVLAAELVRRRVAVIATGGGPAVAFAAKAATTTIPIVFGVAEDPVKLGLVASIARPDGNLTGINFLVGELAAKRLELLAFATLVRERTDALFVGNDAFLQRSACPTGPVGGSSQQPSNTFGPWTCRGRRPDDLDVYRQMGGYAGHLLKGAKPADLPVVQSANFELVINAQTARMLGLTVPPTLLALADEVIE